MPSDTKSQGNLHGNKTNRTPGRIFRPFPTMTNRSTIKTTPSRQKALMPLTQPHWRIYPFPPHLPDIKKRIYKTRQKWNRCFRGVPAVCSTTHYSDNQIPNYPRTRVLI